jgi:hypothetical protein
MPCPSHFTPHQEKDPVLMVYKAGWASGPVWMSVEDLAPTGIRYPYRPAHSESLYLHELILS